MTISTFDIDECARLLNIEKQYALKLAAQVKLPVAKVGPAWVLLVDELVEYLRGQVKSQQPERPADAGLMSALPKWGWHGQASIMEASGPRHAEAALNR